VRLAVRQLPNALTVLRFGLVPLFVVFEMAAAGRHSWPAGIVFGVAGVTDQVDGWLARRLRVESEFGKIADPLADRLMIDAAVLLLVLYDRLHWAALAVVIARDALLIVGARVVIQRGYEFSVNALGKAATWVLYTAVGCVLVTHGSTWWPHVLFWAGVALAIAATGTYILAARRALDAPGSS